MSTSNSSTMDGAMERMFEHGLRKFEEADRRAGRSDDEKTVKLLGVVEVPEMLGTVIEGLWNEGVATFTQWLQPRSLQTFKQWGSKAGLEGNALVRTATLATVGVNTALQSGVYITPVFEAFRSQHLEKKQLARKVAPILDLQGSHSVSALMRTSNDMIRAHRMRMTAQSHAEIKNKISKLLINVTPSLLIDFPNYRHMWNTGEHLNRDLNSGEQRTKDFAARFARIGSAPLASVITRSNDRKLRKQFSSPHSALEMVLELSDQASEKPDATSFSLPGKHGRALPLEAYVREIITQHQRDMADISPEETEIRDALKDDLNAAASTLAEAIKTGEISALSLVQMIGGGMVVKRGGRALADVEEIKEHIAEISGGKGLVYAATDAKEYLRESNFTIDQLKEDLKALKGDERVHYAAMFPNEILKKAGMSEKDIQQTREATAGDAARHISALYLALDAKPDEELKADGLANHEIRNLRQMAKSIHSKGEEAVAKLKTNLGADHAVPNWLVSHAQNFGTVMQDGLARLDALPEAAQQEHADKVGHGSHRAREEHRRSSAEHAAERE